MGIVGLLNRGVSIAKIADREGVSERGMRAEFALCAPLCSWW